MAAARITAGPDSQTVRMEIEMEIDPRKAMTIMFAMHRMPVPPLGGHGNSSSPWTGDRSFNKDRGSAKSELKKNIHWIHGDCPSGNRGLVGAVRQEFAGK